MSYHEYEDGTVRRHYNGHRLSSSDVVRDYDQQDAKTAIFYVRSLLRGVDGLDDAYIAWFEATFEQGGKTIEDFSWREIRDKAEAKLAELKGQI